MKENGLLRSFGVKLAGPQYACYTILRDKPKKYMSRSTKSAWRRFWEAERWLIRHRETCKYYYAWGLNGKHSDPADFIGRREFLRLQSLAEKKLKERLNLSGLDYGSLTKDKFVFGSFLAANGIACIKHHGLIRQGSYTSLSGGTSDFAELLMSERELFVKNVHLEASSGIIHCSYTDGLFYVSGESVPRSGLESVFSKGVWIVQSRVENHASIRRFNRSALNSTRIVTIINDGKPEFLTGFQAFATGEASTDSWDKGAIYVGFDLESECLRENGFYNLSDPRGSLASHHPDTKLAFKDFRIPCLKEAAALCLQAHNLLYANFIIGWDVAITDSGPVIIEANEKPGMNAVQCVGGGIKRRIQNSLRTIIN